MQAEGSNEERISKSVSGGKKAIREVILPSGPKAGYKKGTMAGVHIVDPITGEPLKRALGADCLKSKNANRRFKRTTRN